MFGIHHLVDLLRFDPVDTKILADEILLLHEIHLVRFFDYREEGHLALEVISVLLVNSLDLECPLDFLAAVLVCQSVHLNNDLYQKNYEVGSAWTES